MVEPSKIEEECRRRARINFENNRAWGRKGQEWALEAEHDWQAAEAIASLQKELAERTKELDRAKAIISKACNHLPNGAFCSPQASLDFMEHIPDEVLLVTSRLIGKAEARADALAQALRDIREINDGENWTSIERIDEIAFAALRSLQGGE